MKFKNVLAIIGIFSAALIGVAYSDLGDRFAASNGAHGFSLRVDKTNNTVPGVTASYNLGSAALAWKQVYLGGLTFNPVTLTAAGANITNPSSLVYVGSISSNKTFNLPVPVVGSELIVQDVAGNVSVNGNVTLQAPTGIFVNGVTAGNIVLSTTWGARTLLGIDATHYAAR